MADVTYVSRVRVEPVEGRVRRAYIPGREEPVLFGVHSEVAEHYGVSPDVEDLIPPLSTSSWLLRAADCSEPSGRAGSASDLLR